MGGAQRRPSQSRGSRLTARLPQARGTPRLRPGPMWGRARCSSSEVAPPPSWRQQRRMCVSPPPAPGLLGVPWLRSEGGGAARIGGPKPGLSRAEGAVRGAAAGSAGPVRRGGGPLGRPSGGCRIGFGAAPRLPPGTQPRRGARRTLRRAEARWRPWPRPGGVLAVAGLASCRSGRGVRRWRVGGCGGAKGRRS